MLMRILIYNYFKIKRIFFFLLILLIVGSTNLNAKDDPSKIVEKLHISLINNNNSKENKLKKFKALKQSLEEIYNYKKMISFIYGRKWRTLSYEQKKTLQNLFLEYITINYLQRFSNIKNLEFKLNEVKEFDSKKTLVLTSLVTNENEPININYILILNNEEKWGIFDILYLGSISEIATKKSEFSSFVKENNPEKLIEIMEKKINSFF